MTNQAGLQKGAKEELLEKQCTERSKDQIWNWKEPQLLGEVLMISREENRVAQLPGVSKRRMEQCLLRRKTFYKEMDWVNRRAIP